MVLLVHKIAEEVVNELLSELAGFHVSLHIYFRYVETVVLKHALHGEHVSMSLAPRQRLDGGVYDIGSVLANFEDACHVEAWSTVAVILYYHIGMLLFYHARQFAEQGRLSKACHVLKAYLRRSWGDKLVGNVVDRYGNIIDRIYNVIED